MKSNKEHGPRAGLQKGAVCVCLICQSVIRSTSFCVVWVPACVCLSLLKQLVLACFLEVLMTCMKKDNNKHSPECLWRTEGP